MSERLSLSRFIHDLGWMSALVSGEDAKQVFGRAFSRPPRLLFTNPVCMIFSAYYAYIYGGRGFSLWGTFRGVDRHLAIIYVFLVSVPLAFGSPPFSKEGLSSYEWPQATLSLSYVGMGALLPLHIFDHDRFVHSCRICHSRLDRCHSARQDL
jgi:hypothetical protein